MKRERYFQDELRKMFVSYAVIPVFVFTLVCGVIFWHFCTEGLALPGGRIIS